jgi:hypothetical protein
MHTTVVSGALPVFARIARVIVHGNDQELALLDLVLGQVAVKVNIESVQAVSE